MARIATGRTSQTVLKLLVVLVGLFVFVELIEGLVGYGGIATMQAAVVDALLAGTVPGFLLAGGIGVLIGVVGVLGVLWVLDRL